MAACAAICLRAVFSAASRRCALVDLRAGCARNPPPPPLGPFRLCCRPGSSRGNRQRLRFSAWTGGWRRNRGGSWEKEQRVKTDKTGTSVFHRAHGCAGADRQRSRRFRRSADRRARDGRKRAGCRVAPVVSQVDRFSVCGGGFRGDVDANHVNINGERAFVLASSPECHRSAREPARASRSRENIDRDARRAVDCDNDAGKLAF